MSTQKFRFSIKAIAWESCSMILLAILFLASGSIMGWVSLTFYVNGGDDLLQIISSVVIAIPTLIILVVSFAMIVVAIGRAVFSYLALSGQGLEYRLWPLHRIRCSWNDVGQIKKSTWSFQGDILILQYAEVKGFHLFWDLSSGKGRFIKTLPQIPLHQFNGWPNGKLKVEMQKYAPQLFVEKVS